MTTSVSGTTSSTSTTTKTTASQNRNTFDSSALAQEGYNNKLAKADSLNVKVTKNEAKIAAYQNLQTLMAAVKSPLDTLRSAPGTAGKESDAFLNRSTYLTSSTSTSASSILSATAADGTEVGVHDIVVTQIAKVERLGGSSQSSRSSALSLAGTFTLGSKATADGLSSTVTPGATITITAGMSLDDIANTINAAKTSTGVSASVVKSSDNSYMIVLAGVETDRDITLATGSGDNILSKLGLIDDSGNKVAPLQKAQGAKLTVDSVAITGATNEIKGAIDGVTLSLYKADPLNTLSLEVDSDLKGIKTQITNFVTAYNSLRDFILVNQSTNSDGTAGTDAALFSDSLLREITTSLQSIMTTGVNGVSLATIGITLDLNNKLVVADTTLDTALSSSLSSVKSLFSYQMTSSSPDLELLTHGDGPTSANFDLKVTVDAVTGKVTGASVNGDESLFTFSDNTIKGVAGSIYDGLSLVYSGKTSQTVNVKISQGIADQLYQSIETASNTYNGQITTAVNDLKKDNSDLGARITTIGQNAAIYRDFLLDKYAKVEAKLAKAQSVLDLLKALNSAENKSS
ncbi:flagellar filament capping protein FliD [Magnetospirillum molischianum]|uniref:Flagellar hook-associated protein 2 n=1 Tax=Magnetospirillum molischianum DSM 120 TaxID=1150626 RepID=H8FWB9_MAGML|nr:flagellar filament capping protein FliD [Magnetospirillum molischianum]CCG42657.1 Flagellar hook-associated protein 2 (FliD, filament cap protein) [Magnetospirillum molischianum DSM 120]